MTSNPLVMTYHSTITVPSALSAPGSCQTSQTPGASSQAFCVVRPDGPTTWTAIPQCYSYCYPSVLQLLPLLPLFTFFPAWRSSTAWRHARIVGMCNRYSAERHQFLAAKHTAHAKNMQRFMSKFGKQSGSSLFAQINFMPSVACSDSGNWCIRFLLLQERNICAAASQMCSVSVVSVVSVVVSVSAFVAFRRWFTAALNVRSHLACREGDGTVSMLALFASCDLDLAAAMAALTRESVW